MLAAYRRDGFVVCPPRALVPAAQLAALQRGLAVLLREPGTADRDDSLRLFEDGCSPSAASLKCVRGLATNQHSES
jgi:hypothetical protein